MKCIQNPTQVLDYIEKFKKLNEKLNNMNVGEINFFNDFK